MKFGRLFESYIRMRNSQYKKNWKKEIFLTLKFVKSFDQTKENIQLDFLEYLYDNRLYRKGAILLLSEYIEEIDEC